MYMVTDSFYYTAYPSTQRNVSRSYLRLCRSSGGQETNPVDVLHAVLLYTGAQVLCNSYCSNKHTLFERKQDVTLC